MTDRENDKFEKMKGMLVEAIDLIKKSEKTDDEDLEAEYLDKANALYEAYSKMKKEHLSEEKDGTEERLEALGIDKVTISEIRELSKLLGVSMSKMARVIMSAGLNHTMKKAFRLPSSYKIDPETGLMQLGGISPESVKKALKEMTPDEV